MANLPGVGDPLGEEFSCLPGRSREGGLFDHFVSPALLDECMTQAGWGHGGKSLGKPGRLNVLQATDGDGG